MKMESYSLRKFALFIANISYFMGESTNTYFLPIFSRYLLAVKNTMK